MTTPAALEQTFPRPAIKREIILVELKEGASQVLTEACADDRCTYEFTTFVDVMGHQAKPMLVVIKTGGYE